MGRTVGELLDTIDAYELQEWAAYHDIDPWSEDRADMRAAQICSVVAKVNGAKAEASDFMPKFGPPAELVERSDDELLMRAIKANALMGGTVRRKQR